MRQENCSRTEEQIENRKEKHKVLQIENPSNALR